jgi:hypothetical protein
MASIIKVDQIQSDSGNVSLTGNLSSTTITTSTLSSTTGNVTVTSNVSVVGLQTSSNVSVAGKTLIDSTGRQYSVIGAGTTLFEEYKCRAWVNFNGTGTVAIRASGNVSSITDNGTGTYTVNFTTAMPDANYAVHEQHSTGSAQTTGAGTTPQISTLHTQTTTSVQLQYGFYTGSSNTIANNDSAATFASVSVFR